MTACPFSPIVACVSHDSCQFYAYSKPILEQYWRNRLLLLASCFSGLSGDGIWSVWVGLDNSTWAQRPCSLFSFDSRCGGANLYEENRLIQPEVSKGTDRSRPLDVEFFVLDVGPVAEKKEVPGYAITRLYYVSAYRPFLNWLYPLNIVEVRHGLTSVQEGCVVSLSLSYLPHAPIEEVKGMLCSVCWTSGQLVSLLHSCQWVKLYFDV